MSRTYRFKDADTLIQSHRRLIQSLQNGISAREECQNEALSAAHALQEREAMKILEEIPVEELNRVGRGFRVKALREQGYPNIASLASSSIFAIAAVSGVSEDGAFAIKDLVSRMRQEAQDGLKIRLSIDDRTPASTRLIQALSAFRKIESLSRDCERLLCEAAPSLENAISALEACRGGIRRLFASKQKKEAADEAFRYLSEALHGAYGADAATLLKAVEAARFPDAETAWRDFEQNPIRFVNTLEALEPGLLGNDDDSYGLPADLAQGLEAEKLSLEGLHCELRRYQEWGVRYILHQERVLLGDEMGLGKTVQAIAAMVALRNAGASHFVVVCPASVLTNWQREIQKMSDLPAIPVHGTQKAAALLQWMERGGVAVTTYETADDFLLPQDYLFSLLTVDEAHYIKNPQAQRSIYVKILSGHARRLLFMTGTALENRVDEMISLIRILQPKIADSITPRAYLSTAPQFRQAVAPVYYRRKREDVLTELPQLIESREWCSLGAKEEAIYEDAVLGMRYADARRVSWNVEDLKDSSKAARLKELVEEAAGDGRKILVFSFFLDTIAKVSRLLGDRCLPPITGAVPPQRRQEIVDAFEEAAAGAVLPAQIQSGGTGLNIQSASVVILCEPQFKPSIENQAISRAYRMGQTRNVLVYRLLCENTVDEKLLEVLEEKQAVFDAFADRSIAAEEDLKIEESTFTDILRSEQQRITAKRDKAFIADT